METEYDAYAYHREQWLNSFFAPIIAPVTETDPEVTTEPETVATSSKRTYTPEQQEKRNEQRRARRAAGKAN